MSLMPFEEALDRLLRDVEPLTDVEAVGLASSARRILASDVTALRTQPSFDASAMDGFAVRLSDVTHVPVDLELVGESAAGRGFDGAVASGQAVRIFTGAPMPAGADAVVIQENTSRPEITYVRVEQALSEGANVRPAGNDFSAGDVLVRAGTRLGPASVALVASGGYASASVLRRPRVAIAATGDELVLPGIQPAPSQIVACNGLAVGMIAEDAGAVALDYGIIPDRENDLTAAIHRARIEEVDVLVTIGGASVGDYDLVGPVLKAEGAELDFWKVAMRPGKPLMAGRLDKMRVLGLPGNPASCLVTAELFLRPLVERLGGYRIDRPWQRGVLGRSVRANDHRAEFMRATIETIDGIPTLTPFDRQDSSLLSIFAAADALLVRPPHAPAAKPGQECSYITLRTH